MKKASPKQKRRAASGTETNVIQFPSNDGANQTTCPTKKPKASKRSKRPEKTAAKPDLAEGSVELIEGHSPAADLDLIHPILPGFMEWQLNACQRTDGPPLTQQELEDRYLDTILPGKSDWNPYDRVCEFLASGLVRHGKNITEDRRHVLCMLTRWERNGLRKKGGARGR